MRKILFPALVTFLASPLAFAQDQVPGDDRYDQQYPMDNEPIRDDVDVQRDVELDDQMRAEEAGRTQDIDQMNKDEVTVPSKTEQVRGEEVGATQPMGAQPGMTTTGYEIPREQLPPAGTCRIWDPKLAPTEQHRPMYCADAWMFAQPGDWVIERPAEHLTVVHVPNPHLLENRELRLMEE